SGYPNRRRGEEIPVEARIVALADIYDALRSPRPYKPGLDHAAATRSLLEGDERLDPEGHLDPALLALFAEHHHGFAEIWDRLS
ncbi:MAG TPA: HD domain-containing phosphohydrolase, partial [Candidatus Sulfomarinibacteraceae bacterium]|nr:HD domain-containing phosphohydrolase [Candidatus Sulfomarinibacteraceae bacterium]